MAEKRFRALDSLDLTRADSTTRAFHASVSSETPYERAFGIEVLDHSPEAVDLSRAAHGLPLLFAHDPQRPIGMVESPRLVGRRLVASVRFFSTDEGEDVARMVREGLTTVSIGYLVDRMEQEGERDGTPVYRVRRWTLLEVSVVTIPADTTVGIGRSRIEWKETRTMEHQDSKPINAEADRVKAIVSLGSQYAKYLKPNDVADACQRGVTEQAFRETIMAGMESRHTDTSVAHVGMSPRERERYSFARAIKAVLTNDWREAGLEREASRTIERASGRSPEGFFVPSECWSKRDFNVGTASEAGNLVATNLRTDLYVDALREAMVLAGLGVKFLPGLSGNVDIPRKSSVGALGMLTEIGSASETAPATDKVQLTPKRVGAFIEYSKQALIQSGLALDGMLRDDLVTGAAVLLEYQAINGAGTGAHMLGIRNTTGIGTVVMGTAGAAPDWASVIALESKAADANAVAGALAGYLLNTKTRGKLKQVQKGTSLDLVWGDAAPGADGFSRLNGYRAGVSNNVVANLTKGSSTTVCSAGLFSSDWSMAVLAFFGAPDVTVDPYTLAATGQVRITLNQYADFGVRQPGAFAKVDDWLAG
jgi:HK97 family phage major capsid protein/HK97 family phage prohead protease